MLAGALPPTARILSWPVQLCDYMYTTDGILLANYGVEDVTFTYNAEGKPEFTDLIMNNPDGYSYRDSVALHVIDGLGPSNDALAVLPTTPSCSLVLSMTGWMPIWITPEHCPAPKC